MTNAMKFLGNQGYLFWEIKTHLFLILYFCSGMALGLCFRFGFCSLRGLIDFFCS